MDKNLRAELSALKEEVLANLKGLEKVIANIDSKLTQIDHGQMAQVEELVDPKALEDARAWVREWDDAWDRSVMAQRDKTDQFMNPAPFKDPLGKKELMDLFKEARKWDDWTYELFTTQWNKGKKKRIEGAKNTINTFIADAKARKGTKRSVEDLSDAKRALEEMERFEAAKAKMFDICNTAANELNRFLEAHQDETDDFSRYYYVLNDMMENCNAVKEDLCNENTKTFGTLLWLLTSMLETNELEQFECVSIDPVTFEPVFLAGDRLRKFQSVALRGYKRDLKDAFEFRAANDSARSSMIA